MAFYNSLRLPGPVVPAAKALVDVACRRQPADRAFGFADEPFGSAARLDDPCGPTVGSTHSRSRPMPLWISPRQQGIHLRVPALPLAVRQSPAPIHP